MNAMLEPFVDRIRGATASGGALRIRGGGSKDFYGNLPQGEVLDPRPLRGIVAYDPGELVLTARAGTPLAEVEAALAAQGQMLSFEPPHFGGDATLGGCVAAGLAGPRRASAGTAHGSVRDFVLGATLLDGRARLLRFGGTVMKNVAGYDVARALAGSLGILGLIVELSLKVLPRPRAETTLAFELDEATTLERLNAWAGQPLPLSASGWSGGLLMLRLSGAEAALRAAQVRLGGEAIAPQAAALYWEAIREQRLPYFGGDGPLWRFALPSVAAPLAIGAPQLIEWGGAQRWLRSSAPAATLRARAAALGGHATLFRGGDRATGVFTPLSAALRVIHARLKAEFDPSGVFNPGRLVQGL
jgi:glycolate oxidase FAD binding subunit